MARTDINEYANSLLLDFLDAFHECIRADLTAEYGHDWLDRGVKKHFKADYFDRAREMLESPMRVVDMGKSDEELLGVEHLWNIVSGNWQSIYKSRFGDRTRTEACFSEIAEVRHNVSHRRRHHYLRRAELVRFAQNCSMLLRAVGSAQTAHFESLADTLAAGATPWGASLPGYLPPQDEVVEEFVGRPLQLRELTAWLAGTVPQLLVWGYGGAGKSALAYEFAREMRDSSPSPLHAICWVSAKRIEYVEGQARPRRADFIDRSSLARAIFNAVYDVELNDEELGEEELLKHLRDTPVLLVVDDFDTVINDDDLVEFLMHDIRTTGTRVLYTSRQKVTGLRSIEVLGFEGGELEEFARLRAFEHGLDPDACSRRLTAVASVTGGFPLFVDDLLRYARLTGIDEALREWSQRKGDAAREYALRRQLEQLGPVSQEVLMALSVSDRALTTLELSTLAGVTDDDAEHAVNSLLDWRLINRVAGPDESRPGFTMNLNTRRLVQRTYGDEPRMEGFRSKFRALGSSKVPAAKAAAIASAIGVARSLVIRGDVQAAINQLTERMTGELAESADLYGALGWAYSRLPDAFEKEARGAFEAAYERGNTKEDTYYHWASMELEYAQASVGRIPDADLLTAWRRSSRAAQLGIKVSGATRPLCYIAAYAHSREGKTLEHLNEFTQAQGAYGEAVSLFRAALQAPPSPLREISREVCYRGLTLALEGLGDARELQEPLQEWAAIAGGDEFFRTEYRRLAQKFPELDGMNLSDGRHSI